LNPALGVGGPILVKWRDTYGGSSGQLGAPVSDIFRNTDGQYQCCFENGYLLWSGSGEASDMQSWPTTFSDWQASYYNNAGLLGSPVFVRNETEINYDWGGTGPEGGKLGVLPVHFSVRWSRQVDAGDGGNFVFNVTADDGFRLFVDDQSVTPSNPDQFWQISAPAAHQFQVYLGAGSHHVVLEYLQWEGNASIQLSYNLQQ
jgi:hypothetical protein